MRNIEAGCCTQGVHGYCWQKFVNGFGEAMAVATGSSVAQVSANLGARKDAALDRCRFAFRGGHSSTDEERKHYARLGGEKSVRARTERMGGDPNSAEDRSLAMSILSELGVAARRRRVAQFGTGYLSEAGKKGARRGKENSKDAAAVAMESSFIDWTELSRRCWDVAYNYLECAVKDTKGVDAKRAHAGELLQELDVLAIEDFVINK